MFSPRIDKPPRMRPEVLVACFPNQLGGGTLNGCREEGFALDNIPESRKIKRYVYGLALQIRGMVAATEPKTIQKAVQISGATSRCAVTKDQLRNENHYHGNVLRLLERTKEKARLLMSAKANERKQEENFVVVRIFLSIPDDLSDYAYRKLSFTEIDLIPGATPYKSPYRNTSELEDCLETQRTPNKVSFD
ncbi:hypothetical protein Tco_0337721 [Tanacetum coccineum]